MYKHYNIVYFKMLESGTKSIYPARKFLYASVIPLLYQTSISIIPTLQKYWNAWRTDINPVDIMQFRCNIGNDIIAFYNECDRAIPSEVCFQTICSYPKI